MVFKDCLRFTGVVAQSGTIADIVVRRAIFTPESLDLVLSGESSKKSVRCTKGDADLRCKL